MEKKKSNYIVEESMYTNNLEKLVSEMMEEGYIPHGSMVIGGSNSSIDIIFYQPMILKEKNNKKIL